MRVRDAVEDDGTALADLADVPTEVMVNVVHDRTVRVAEPDDERDSRAADGEHVVGFVGFDARRDAVLVTHLEGPTDVRNELLDEPIRFGRKEGMAVEMLVPKDEEDTRELVDAAGFERRGTGPRFDGQRTLKFRLERPRS